MEHSWVGVSVVSNKIIIAIIHKTNLVNDIKIIKSESYLIPEKS